MPTGRVGFEAVVPNPKLKLLDQVREVLRSGRFADDVRHDLETAARFGINSVPCFVIDRKYAVSGAQGSSALLQALQQARSEPADGEILTP